VFFAIKLKLVYVGMKTVLHLEKRLWSPERALSSMLTDEY
jgi:hypothetical protein